MLLKPYSAQDGPKPKTSTVPRLSDPESGDVTGDVLVLNTLICFILSMVPVYIPVSWHVENHGCQER